MLIFGKRIGPYEIIAAIGAGGMGEVYRARDARLGRDVAIKVLPENLAADKDRLARFEKEARSRAGDRENGAGEMQSATGSGETAARTGIDAGGAQIHWGVFVFVGAAGAVCAEPGRRRSRQVGHGRRTAQVGRFAGTAECGAGGDLRAAGSGVGGDAGARSGGAAGVVWIEGTGAEPADSRDV